MSGGAHMKPYPEYKYSGVEWLGEVPCEWHACRLQYCASVNDESLGEDTPTDYNIAYVDIGGVSSEGTIAPPVEMLFGDAPSRARRIVKNSDVLVSTVRTYLKAIAPVENAPPNLIASTGFAVLRPLDCIHRRFLAYALRQDGFVSTVVANSVGISYPAINASDLVKIPIPLPPLAEQEKIAAFLDYETERMDQLIEKQEKLIELLKEKRQAVISHAVTKGLNPDAPMKDSGVEWLGEVPAHWGVVATSRCSDLTTGSRDTQDSKPEGQYPFFVRSQEIERIGSYSFDGEGVLTSGDGAGVGKIFHHYIGKLEFHQRVYLFYNFKGVIGLYFFYFLREHLAIVALAGNAKSTIDSLRRPMLRSFPICRPPLAEQEAIVAYLADQTDRMDLAVGAAERAIALLRERRTAVISAAVTGKIDVRDWQPPREEAAS